MSVGSAVSAVIDRRYRGGDGLERGIVRSVSLCLHGRDGHAPFLAALGERCILIEIRSEFRYEGGGGERTAVIDRRYRGAALKSRVLLGNEMARRGSHGAEVALKRMLSMRLVASARLAPETVRRTWALAWPSKPARVATGMVTME